jgi:transcriptional regulator NrdR family protein
MQLKVVKADGTVEQYLHTKVLGTINNALAVAGLANIDVTEHLAGAITYYLYNQRRARTVTSSEILSMIQVVLAETLYGEAAEALSEHHYRRQLGRRRIEVTDDQAAGYNEDMVPQRWDKSRVVQDLVVRHKLERSVARTIAAMVEERVLNLGLARVSSELIKQLVLADTAAVLRAQVQLRALEANGHSQQHYADTDICLRQQQEGVCTVGP